MGAIYDLESELRVLCTDYNNNEELIYEKLSELVRRLLKRNQSHIGSGVNKSTLCHEIVAEIMIKLKNGSIDSIKLWSGYIKKILPRMLKSNAKTEEMMVINPLYDEIDPNKLLEISYSSEISIMKDRYNSLIYLDLDNLSSLINSWMNKNIKVIDKNSKEYCNMRVSLILSLVKNKVVKYRLYI